jgi:catechol 2,3-dioxygenase-like lactoylglutathione lyase family enzyme
MLSHVFVGVTDFARAFGFYESLMTELGLTLKFSEPEKPWAGWMRAGVDRPLFLIGHPYNGQRAAPGNGQMIALLAPNRKAVDGCYARAIANGAQSEGQPGLRPHYHPHYYGAYFRDPDGNKLCVCCHGPEG